MIRDCRVIQSGADLICFEIGLPSGSNQGGSNQGGF